MNTRWYIFPLLLLFAVSITVGQSGAPTPPPDDPSAPQNLGWSLTQEGHMRLTWDEPNVDLAKLDRYEVWRTPLPMDVEPPYTKVANTNFERHFVDLAVKPGDGFSYRVWAVYKDFAQSTSITVKYPVSSPVLEIVSTPPSTAKAGDGYEYRIQLNADPRLKSIDVRLEGPPDGGVPPGSETHYYAGAFHIRWDTTRTGVYNFTLVVTGTDPQDANYKATATQKIRLVVAPRTGAVDISVRGITGEPVPFSAIQLILLPDDIDDTKVIFITNEHGNASISDVPVGKIIAFCHPGDERYAPRYYHPYTVARTLSEAEMLQLGEDQVILLEFILQNVGDDRVTVSGAILSDSDQAPVPGAKIHFIRKNNFILFGDENFRTNPALLENWGASKIDTTVTSDAIGMYSTLLPVGVDYFMIVEKEGFLEAFNPDLYYNASNTNVLESRPFETKKHTDRRFNYRIIEKDPVGHSIQGVIRREDNNLNEPATVLLIQKEVKVNRGAGGGVFFGYSGVRSVLTDSNGVYEFKDVAQNQYILFAIPLNRDVVPQYYTGHTGGAMTFDNSDLVSVAHTIQGIDFNLRSALNDGIGVAYGTINLKINDDPEKRLSGAVVCAIDIANDRIAGYSISDTLGWYTIPNLRPGTYEIFADHPNHGWAKVQDVEVKYETVNDQNREQRRDLTIHIKPVGIKDFDPSAIPGSIVLYQNYPNPFNPSTNIKFGLHKRSAIKLTVFNAFGQEVQVLEEGKLDPGSYSFQFDASTFASGMYFYRLTADDKTITKSMMLVK